MFNQIERGLLKCQVKYKIFKFLAFLSVLAYDKDNIL